MTIIEAINKIDELKPNGYTQSQKVEWLSKVDGMVKRLIIDTHAGWQDVTFNGYTDDTPLTTQLIAQDPFDEMYIYWLESKIDYANGEIARYNNSVMMFSDRFDSYKNYYNSTHMPLTAQIKYF